MRVCSDARMMPRSPRVVSGVLLLASFLLAVLPAPAQEIGRMDFPEGEVQHVVRADDTPWGPCPPNVPPACRMAVLDGDPRSEDLFTVRFFVAEGESLVMAPHTHPADERVTVISGGAAVAFGADATRADATLFGPGDYYVNARNAVHQVWIDGPSVLQVTGIGPWKAIPAGDGQSPD